MLPSRSDENFQVPAEVHGEKPSDLHLQLWDLFVDTARAYPHRDAIVSLWQPQDNPDLHMVPQAPYLRWTFADLLEKSSHLAGSLRTRIGSGNNKSLAALLWNSAEWALFFWATIKLGMTFVVLDPRDTEQCRTALASLKPQVVVVQDDEGAEIVNGLASNVSFTGTRIQCSVSENMAWTSLEKLLSEVSSQNNHQIPSSTIRDSTGIALIIYTSGTTGLPKGCPHTHRALVSQTQKYDFNSDPDLIDRWLVHTPVSHIFAINNTLRAWRYGEAVVFASKTFDVEATIHALIQEQCTIMSATPTLAKSLVAHSRFPTPEDINLSVVTIAGTNITPKDITLCRQQLGAKDAIQAYGMSEGAPLASWSRADELLMDGYHPGVGKILPGAAMKICAHGCNTTLNRNEVGELHVGGPSVIENYVDNVDTGAFYRSASQTWLRTGDEAMIDDNDVLHVFGRYKDIIIRGGENLYPSKLEVALMEIPGVQAHVVGIPDDVAGQVPIAIVKLPIDVSKSQIREQAANMGPRYVLDCIYTLEELGLQDVPVTSLGKVRKEELAKLVRSKMSHEFVDFPARAQGQSQNLEQILCVVWESLIGTTPASFQSVTHLADSITMLRYCDAVFRATGTHIYLQELMEHDTVHKQAQLLRSRADEKGARFKSPVHAETIAISQDGCSVSPVLSDTSTLVAAHMQKDAGHRAGPSKERGKEDGLLSISENMLEELGLDISAVEGVLPIRAAHHRMAQGQRPQAYLNRTIFRVPNASREKIQRAVEKALLSRPMFRSVLIHDSKHGFSHAVLRPSHQLFDDLISHITVNNDKSASDCWHDDSETGHSSRHMFQAKIISIEESKECLLSMTYNHSAMDALSLLSWHQDLDRILENFNAEGMKSTPYRFFADLFCQYQDSAPALKAVKYHVSRLRGISRCKTAIWPPQKAPGCMISNDKYSEYAETRALIRNQIWNGEWEARSHLFRYPRLGRIVYLPSLRKLKSCHIEPSLFARCALVLFNVLKNGSSYAVFNTWESGRSWPFVPKWIEETLPPTMSIDGPTVEWVLNMFEVDQGETVMQFFQRMALEREALSRHEHVPWQKVVEELRDEGEIATDASFRQSFVWDMSLGMQQSGGFLKSLEPVARLDWADCCLFWNAFMADKDNLYFVASWDTAQMNDTEVDSCCNLLAGVMRALAAERNWERKVGQVLDMV